MECVFMGKVIREKGKRIKSSDILPEAELGY